MGEAKKEIQSKSEYLKPVPTVGSTVKLSFENEEENFLYMIVDDKDPRSLERYNSNINLEKFPKGFSVNDIVHILTSSALAEALLKSEGNTEIEFYSNNGSQKNKVTIHEIYFPTDISQ
ncbi:hypothetical protein M1145_01625 [Patescibacteria group bacterium]|nr:hypothetical protein [Patescibacteria group bacterium]